MNTEIKNKKPIESAIEENTKRLILDIINEVNEEMLDARSSLDTHMLGLELLANLYRELENSNIEKICGIEYTYRNGNIYELHEYLNE